ncbi:hypothetical protein Agub_g356 [Astrephomene gubernaculifera]|uniref:Guanylate cyclase domain-containing protein n=1 Tax=Astrephomene gubernaculifera TaxID=47775 RepID=A0AAD3HGK0_9CHLO|nr:hypothetical protein Agub_g356 [Astrephomene gubernaculifera]
MGGLFECCLRPSVVPIGPEQSTPPSSVVAVTPEDHIGNDLGGKQPLAERKQQDSLAMGHSSTDATSISPSSGVASSQFPQSRSRQRRQSMEAGEALSTTLEIARQRRASSTYEQMSTSGQPGAKGLMNWGWLKGHSSRPLGPAQPAEQQTVSPSRGLQRMRDSSASTAESLQRRGFPVHYAKDIHKTVSTSTTKPIAVLGLEPSSESSDTGGVHMEQAKTSADGSPELQSRRNHNKLFPLYVNGVAKSYFKIGASRDYAQVLRRLLRRDPLLTFALQKAIKNLSKGDCKPISHVTSDPTGASASLYGLRITPCVWSDANGHKLPALLLEHNVPYESQDVMPRLLRDYAVLSHVPSILTLIDFNGHVLYQNAASIDYCGDLTSHNVETGDGMMGILFQYEPQLLQEMLQEVNEGNYWQQVVRVPASLKRHMVFEPENTWGYGSRGAGKKLTAAVSKRFHQDDLEPEFQLESFTTQNARSQRNNNRKLQPMFSSQPSMVRSESMARVSHNLPIRQDTRDSGVAIAGPAALPVGRLGSITGSAPRLASHTLPSGTHVAFNLPNQPNQVEEQPPPQQQQAQGSNPQQHNGSFTALGKPGGPTPHSHLANTGQNRRFMTLMQSAAAAERQQQQQQIQQQQLQQQQQPSFTGSSPVEQAEGERPDARLSAMVQEECWHDISAIPLLDPVLDKQVILLLQTNVTARVELENRLADLTDAQLGMLEQLFPRHVIEYMLSHKHGYNSRNLTHLANHHDDVIVLFTDVVGFTSMSKEVEPSEVMHFLNELYTIFDDLVDDHDLYKLDTVGDCYIVVAGLTMQDDDGFTCTVQADTEQRLQHAQVMMNFAKAILRESKQVLMPHNHCPVQIRIGIHLGSLASGLVGPKMPKFTLFGDTMNTASRMESTCRPGCVQVSEIFARLLPLEDWQDTGGVEVKGKGHMQTFLWIPKPEDLIPHGVGPRALPPLEDPPVLPVDDGSVPAAAAGSLSPSAATSTAAASTAATPEDPTADRMEVDPAALRSVTASPLTRPKSSRPYRPKSSRPRSSRYLRPSTARLRESRDGGPGAAVMSRPSTASSYGGLGRTASLTRGNGGRSMSRRNVSFRFQEESGNGDDDEEEERDESTPFMAILNAIRGSGTGDGDDLDVQRVSYTSGTISRRDLNGAAIRVSSDGDDGDSGMPRKAQTSRFDGILAGKRASNGYPGSRRSSSGLPMVGGGFGGAGFGGRDSRVGTCNGDVSRFTTSNGDTSRFGTANGDGGGRMGGDVGAEKGAVDALRQVLHELLPAAAAKPDNAVKPVKAVRLALSSDALVGSGSQQPMVERPVFTSAAGGTAAGDGG